MNGQAFGKIGPLLTLAVAAILQGSHPKAAACQDRAGSSGARAKSISKPTVVLKPGEVPGIKFDTPEYEFGRVRAGKDIIHDFWFTNTGTGPLELLRVKPSCGCTTAGNYDRIVQPGKSGRIPIRMGTGKADGTMNKSVRVTTNIPGSNSSVTLRLKGQVWQPVEVKPPTATFGRITNETASESLEQTLMIVNRVGGDFKIGNVRSSDRRFTASVAPADDGKTYTLTVTLVPPLKPGQNAAKITMTTGIREKPKLEVGVYAFVTTSIDISPKRMILKRNRPAPITRKFYIRNNTKEPFRITNLKATNPGLKIELKDIRNSLTYRLTVEVPKDYTPAPGGDTISFNTDNPAAPLLEISIIEKFTNKIRMHRPKAAKAGDSKGG